MTIWAWSLGDFSCDEGLPVLLEFVIRDSFIAVLVGCPVWARAGVSLERLVMSSFEAMSTLGLVWAFGVRVSNCVATVASLGGVATVLAVMSKRPTVCTAFLMWAFLIRVASGSVCTTVGAFG